MLISIYKELEKYTIIEGPDTYKNKPLSHYIDLYCNMKDRCTNCYFEDLCNFIADDSFSINSINNETAKYVESQVKSMEVVFGWKIEKTK